MAGFALWLLGLGKGLFGGIGKAVAGLFAWILDDARHLAIAGLIALLAINVAGNAIARRTLADERDRWRTASARWQAASHKWRDAAQAWKGAHGRLVANVGQAQRAAAEADRRNVARVAAEFATINERTVDAYRNRLDDTRAAGERLRVELDRIAAGDPRDGRAATVPAPLTARCRAVGAADCDALLAALPGLLTEAERNTAKLIALQDYTRAMLAIDYSGEAGMEP